MQIRGAQPRGSELFYYRVTSCRSAEVLAAALIINLLKGGMWGVLVSCRLLISSSHKLKLCEQMSRKMKTKRSWCDSDYFTETFSSFISFSFLKTKFLFSSFVLFLLDLWTRLSQRSLETVNGGQKVFPPENKIQWIKLFLCCYLPHSIAVFMHPWRRLKNSENLSLDTKLANALSDDESSMFDHFPRDGSKIHRNDVLAILVQEMMSTLKHWLNVPENQMPPVSLNVLEYNTEAVLEELAVMLRSNCTPSMRPNLKMNVLLFTADVYLHEVINVSIQSRVWGVGGVRSKIRSVVGQVETLTEWNTSCLHSGW